MLILAKSLPNSELIALQLQDDGYDRVLQSHNSHGVKLDAAIKIIMEFCSFLRSLPSGKVLGDFLSYVLRYNITVDKTLNDKTLAQIQFVVKKSV